jgi:hypothetical protein
MSEQKGRAAPSAQNLREGDCAYEFAVSGEMKMNPIRGAAAWVVPMYGPVVTQGAAWRRPIVVGSTA